MRKAALTALLELAREDPRVMLLTADLGFGVVDDFARELPGQFINVGVAEQAMIGLATGMAEAGLRPYCYSIATFALLRPFEFVRNGPVGHRLPVTVIGVGAGTDYSLDGLTHFAVEDLALARSQPGLTIYAPVTAEDTQRLVREAHAAAGPAYFRLSRAGAPHPSRPVRGENAVSTDVVVLAVGIAHERAMAVADAIVAAGRTARLLSVQQFDDQTASDLAPHLAQARACVTVEDHYRVGGLGSAVADVIATNGFVVPLVIDAIEALPVGALGSSAYLEGKLHRPVAHLVEDVLERIKPVGDRW